jgi:hypothetical protein
MHGAVHGASMDALVDRRVTTVTAVTTTAVGADQRPGRSGSAA